ncbi:hypothetical protein PFNF135_02667 [Plasmodium falciparum NF135/5.C10]|uniref:Uncharacterized protein n=1 Tax=Plasmodium falciparum NF135/5.C10 TaxID=1036726 RepID=W4IHM4_PLAFA|nr:hypothetical protein PFNF135_02667 [Plasmodium falciparum NF135/5.C10]
MRIFRPFYLKKIKKNQKEVPFIFFHFYFLSYKKEEIYNIYVCSKRRNIPGFNRPKISPFRGRGMKSALGVRGRLRQPSFRPFYRGRGAYKKIVTNPYERT